METSDNNFLVVVSETQQYACWPQSAGAVPEGWMVVAAPTNKATALEHIRALQKNPFLAKADFYVAWDVMLRTVMKYAFFLTKV